MEKSFAGEVILLPQPDVLFQAISDCIHGLGKQSSLPASVPPGLVDLYVWWNLDGCLDIGGQRSEFVPYDMPQHVVTWTCQRIQSVAMS